MIKNASILPKVYFGLHFAEGCARYNDIGEDAYNILIKQDTAKKMNSTYQGRPLFVHHKDEVVLDKIQTEADGFVVKSFYNELDGKHWAEFIVVSDRGHDAIRKKWKLSNAYNLKSSGAGGMWHGMEYSKEVLDAEYDHLALVDDPRYSESMILTPEEFQAYNAKLRADHEKTKFLNSNSDKPKENKMLFDVFKKEKVKNSEDMHDIMVTLPKSKKDFTFEQIVNMADSAECKKNEAQKASDADLVEVDGKMLTIAELKKAFMDLKAKAEEKPVENEDKEEEKSKDDEKKKENEEDKEVDEDKKENADEEDKEEKKANSKYFNDLKNAHLQSGKDEEVVVELSTQRVARGKARYGS